MDKKFLLIYHKEDNDGVFSGALFNDYLNTNGGNVELIEADYKMMDIISNTVLKNAESYDSIILTDISFNHDVMKRLYSCIGNKLIWIDHHAPIIDASFKEGFDNIQGIRDTKHSAVYLAWCWLYNPFRESIGGVEIPYWVDVLSAWDSWTYDEAGFERDFCFTYNKGFTVKFGLDIDKATDFVSSSKSNGWRCDAQLNDAVYNVGLVSVNAEKMIIDNIIDNYSDNNWIVNGERAVAFIWNGTSNSLMFEKFRKTDIKHGVVIKMSPNTDGVGSISLYNVNDSCEFHCGRYMREKYNGGGHQGAAGCVITNKSILKLLKNKEL